MVVLSRKQRAHVIIHNAAAAAGGIGAGWISELVLVRDTIPLGVLEAVMMAAIGLSFGLQRYKVALVALVGGFCCSLLWRGVSVLLLWLVGDHQILINVAVAVVLTELQGWLLFRVCAAMRRRARGPTSWVTGVVRLSRRGPLRVAVSSSPMVVALAAALGVFNVRHQLEVQLRAPQGTAPLVIEYPLVERNEGLLYISGLAREGAWTRMQVRNDTLADQLERKALRHSPPRVRLEAWVPPERLDWPTQIVDGSWSVELRMGSDYWHKVRGRLYLLVLGLLGTLAMAWLSTHRSDINEE